jgi:hypothetical protein
MARSLPMKLEPKTFFANERTFLAWLHMAITLGSIAAALLGFSAGRGAWAQRCVSMQHLSNLPFTKSQVWHDQGCSSWPASVEMAPDACTLAFLLRGYAWSKA